PPAHAPGSVNVVVTNPDSSSGTRNGGFTYVAQQFDPNGDGVIDPADIFYLVNYLFLNGPAPSGPLGMLSGDANGDGVVDPADIFYLINYLFMGGPAPLSLPPSSSAHVSAAGAISGSVTLGKPETRGSSTFVPVIVTPASGSPMPQAISLKIRFNHDADGVAIHRAGAAKDLAPAFETS